MHVYGRIQGTLSAPAGISGTLSAPKGIGGTLTVPAALLPPSFEGPYEVTPTEYTQTLETKELYMDDDITVNPIPDPYIVPTGTLEISQNGEADVTDYAAVDVDVQPALQNKSVTVSSSGDTEITADDGYYGLSSATATVPTGSASQGTLFGFIESGTKWRVRGYNDVNTAGWFDTGRSQGSDTKFNAVPSGTTVTPTESSQTVGGSDYMMQGAVTVNAIASDYVGSAVPQKASADLTASGPTVTAPSGYYAASASKTIPDAVIGEATIAVSPQTPSINSSTGVVTASVGTTTGEIKPVTTAGYVYTTSAVPYRRTGGSKTLQLDTQSAATITPTESSQTAVSAGKYTTGAVTVDAVPSDYVGTAIDRRDSSDLSASGATVSAPAGYYGSAASKSVASGSATTPATSITANPSISVNSSTGVITATTSATKSVTPTVSAGYVSSGTAGTVTVSGSNTSNLSTQAGTTITPSTSQQTAVAAGKYTTGAIKVDPIPSEYIIPSGTKSITANGTGIDVKQYEYANVNVSGGAPVLETVTKSYTPTESAQSETITPSTGYDGIGEVDVSVGAISSTYVGSGVTRRDSTNLSASGATVTAPAGYYAANATKTISSGSATPASSISGTSATVSTGTNTLTLSKTVQNTPQVSAGYISSGTAGNSSVSLTASVTTKAATTYHPSTSNQMIASGTYTTGTQTINAVTLSNLTADNIKSGVTVQIGDASDSDCVASVTGTYSGGGGGSLSYDTKTATASNYPVSLSFTSMKGQPKFFAVRLNAQVSSSGSTTYYYIVDIVSNCNGSSAVTHGNCFRIGSTRRVDNITSGYSYTYSGTTLTITSSAASRSASPGAFYNGSYELIYAY